MNTKVTGDPLICLAILLAHGAVVWATERIVLPDAASALQRLAGQELRRYVYLRTGQLLPLTSDASVCEQAIILARQDRLRTTDPGVKAVAHGLKPQEYVLKTTAAAAGKKTWWIIGGDDLGTLYGAYRFTEKLGVRFYLHADVVPDGRLAAIPDINETGKPLFALRGVNPWGSHPFGFDAWGEDQYKAVFSQLAKMRMNFLGIHCYPEGHPYAEPTVWHGLSEDFDAQGRVRFSYPSHYYNTLLPGAWGPMLPKKTSAYSFGGSLLFEDEAWAPAVMRGHCPAPRVPEACNDVFNRMAVQFHEAFGFAHTLGVKTCIGTEAPLILPRALQERIKAHGKEPRSPDVVREIYQATFRRIMASHPLDYYWVWTPEDWTWGGNKPEQYEATVRDLKLAHEALHKVGAPFRLATCGWVLGPQNDRAALDQVLPGDMPISSISRDLGYAEVDPAYARIRGREKWAIPWLESDSRHGLAAVQLVVGRMRRDAADALAYGCTGLIGLQWRTDILGPNIAALSQAAWSQADWYPSPGQRPVEAAPTVEGPLGGHTANYPGRKIAGTSDAALYQTCRYGLDGYNLKLPNGNYRVTLKFCEPHFDAPGKRIGDFKLQGKTVLKDLDIFARVGKFAALDFVFENIDIADGWLRLRVEARTSLPCISAIVAEGRTVTRKIHCGGPAYKDFEADLQVMEADRKRFLPCADFYADWARANFGSAEGDAIGRLFTAVDGRVPRSVADACPSGSLQPDPTPWPQVAKSYSFVAELEQLRPRVKGPGNRERFDWWLNTFRYHRHLAEIRCALGVLAVALKGAEAASDPARRRQQVEAALSAYQEVVRLYGEAYRLLLATVNTAGGLATVVNLENNAHFWPVAIDQPAARLRAASGGSLPPGAVPQKQYQGEPRLIVPTVRTLLAAAEPLRLQVIVLDNQPVRSAVMLWRPLGVGPLRTMPLKHLARGVYQVELSSPGVDFEYRIEATTLSGVHLSWPSTAPETNQTVVLLR